MDAIKALTGDPDNEIIKAGTLAVTRGGGVVAAAVIAAAQLEWPFEDLSSNAKLTAAIASVAVWAFLASADALARGYVTGAAKRAEPGLSPRVHAFAEALDASLPSMPRDEEEGWKVHLMRIDPKSPDKLQFFATRQSVGQWVDEDRVVFR